MIVGNAQALHQLLRDMAILLDPPSENTYLPYGISSGKPQQPSVIVHWNDSATNKCTTTVQIHTKIREVVWKGRRSHLDDHIEHILLWFGDMKSAIGSAPAKVTGDGDQTKMVVANPVSDWMKTVS